MYQHCTELRIIIEQNYFFYITFTVRGGECQLKLAI